MPRVLNYTPAWLSRPSPGFELFDTSLQAQETRSTKASGSSTYGDYIGPNRSIARRNTEVFVVVGKHIRWADLPSLKDQWQALQETPSKLPKTKSKSHPDQRRDEDVGPEDGSYRVLKPSIGEPIRQLLISPNENLMAIVTSHTVHIAVLPNPDLLNAEHNKQPIKLRTYTIGPTTHVLSQSSTASVLWHPLGEAGNCLVTTTTDAVVRLWEIDTNNRWSADSPTLGIDLKKLLVATSESDDIGPNRAGRNKVFTADAAGMEVASACFGGAGYGDESHWSAMTLWIAMKGGDLYALCPLLPTKWQPPTNLLAALSSAIVEKKISREDESAADMLSTQQCDDQFAWIQDLDKQEPMIMSVETESSLEIEVYKRPSRPGPVPRLQGPFSVMPEDPDDSELSDIRVIAAKTDERDSKEDDSDDSDSEAGHEAGLSRSIVCLMTREGRVSICLDLDGVEAQWLPRKPPNESLPAPPDPSLVVLESLDTLRHQESSLSEWPTFSEDVESRYSFFTTSSRGVYYFSVQPWLQKLEEELQVAQSEGMRLRLSVLRDSLGTLRQRILSFDQRNERDTKISIPACLTMQDSDLGYFLLTTSKSQAQAAILDKPCLTSLPYNDYREFQSDGIIATRGLALSAYQPSRLFYAPSSLPSFLDTHVQARHKRLLRDEIRLSTSTLDLMTEAHRVLSRETHRLGEAAAELFRRCQTLQDELRHQILKAGEVAHKIDQVTCEDPEGFLDGIEGKGRAGTVLEERIGRVRERQGRLAERCEELRRNVKQIESGKLSEREKAWKAEIEGVGAVIEGTRSEERARVVEASEDGEVADGIEDGEVADNKEDEVEAYDETAAKHLHRYREVQDLKHKLVQRATDLSSDDAPSSPQNNGDSSDKESNNTIPSAIRKKRVAEVDRMLKYESFLVEAAQARLEQLTLATVV